MNTSDFCMYGGCWSTYIHKWPNIGNALRGLFTGTQSEKDGSNKARALSHMSLGVISTKQEACEQPICVRMAVNGNGCYKAQS